MNDNKMFAVFVIGKICWVQSELLKDRSSYNMTKTFLFYVRCLNPNMGRTSACITNFDLKNTNNLSY